MFHEKENCHWAPYSPRFWAWLIKPSTSQPPPICVSCTGTLFHQHHLPLFAHKSPCPASFQAYLFATSFFSLFIWSCLCMNYLINSIDIECDQHKDLVCRRRCQVKGTGRCFCVSTNGCTETRGQAQVSILSICPPSPNLAFHLGSGGQMQVFVLAQWALYKPAVSLAPVTVSVWTVFLFSTLTGVILPSSSCIGACLRCLSVCFLDAFPGHSQWGFIMSLTCMSPSSAKCIDQCDQPPLKEPLLQASTPTPFFSPTEKSVT